MTNTIAQEFSLALTQDKAEQDSFKPLIEKFNELKEVLEHNFEVTNTYRKWYGVRITKTIPFLNVSIHDKIVHNSTCLVICINSTEYVMGIGELKDQLYFITGSNTFRKHDKTLIYMDCSLCGPSYYYPDNKITTVQLFANLIKNYRQYLVVSNDNISEKQHEH